MNPRRKKMIYIVGNFNGAYGAEGAVDIEGVYDSRGAAEQAIAEFNEDRVSTLRAAGIETGSIDFEIHELPLNIWIGGL